MIPAQLHELLDVRTEQDPTAPAVVHGAERWSYAELRERSLAAADWLRRHGARDGDRILILASNQPQVVALLYAISRVGALYVIISDQMRAYQLEHIVSDCTPTIILGSDTGMDSVCELGHQAHLLSELPSAAPDTSVEPAPRRPSDPVSLIYTSGSTSMPKAVVSTHRQVLFATDAIQDRLAYRSEDVVFCCLPLSFDYGLYQVFLCCSAGALLVLGNDSDAGPALLDRLITHDVSVLPLVPSVAATLVRLIHRVKRRPDRLRMVTNTGADLPRSSATALRELQPGLEVIFMFGLTECKRVSIAPPNVDLERPGSVGLPLRGTTVSVVDEDGQPVPPGELGELVVRGPHVMAGYWRAPQLTSQRFRFAEDGAVALHTGDRCRIDEDGHLYFVGRSDDIYKQKGFRVSAVEVEAAAMDIPGVELVVVLPPDGHYGARLAVSGSIDGDQLAQRLSERLEPYKMPSEFHTLPDLPVTVNGKLDKREVAKKLASVRGGTSR